MKKIMLAYSGGLDTSCLVSWLKDEYDAEVIAYCADVGQTEDFDLLKKKAINSGASFCVVDDLKEQFVTDYIFPALKANASYEDFYLLGTALARPCIAKGLIQAAIEHGCDAIAHGATGKGNDQVRFELAVKALNPSLKVIAPWRHWQFTGRQDLFKYASEKGISVPVTPDKPYSIDQNLMHISYEGGILEDPWMAPPEEMFLWTSSPEAAPDEAEYLEIEFEEGLPVSLNGQQGSPLELLQSLNEIAAMHGVGRIDIVENRFIGIKSRGVYETPGMTVLTLAHKALESITLDKEVSHLKQSVSDQLGKLIYNGFWFAPETKIHMGTVEATQKTVTGVVKLKLYKGSASVLGRKSDCSLYKSTLSSFESMHTFNQTDSEGFININGLRLSVWSETNESIEKGVPAGA